MAKAMGMEMDLLMAKAMGMEMDLNMGMRRGWRIEMRMGMCMEMRRGWSRGMSTAKLHSSGNSLRMGLSTWRHLGLMMSRKPRMRIGDMRPSIR